MKTKSIRDSLNALLVQTLSDAEWKWLIKRRYVDEVSKGEGTLDELAREIRDLRSAFGRPDDNGEPFIARELNPSPQVPPVDELENQRPVTSSRVSRSARGAGYSPIQKRRSRRSGATPSRGRPMACAREQDIDSREHSFPRRRNGSSEPTRAIGSGSCRHLRVGGTGRGAVHPDRQSATSLSGGGVDSKSTDPCAFSNRSYARPHGATESGREPLPRASQNLLSAANTTH